MRTIALTTALLMAIPVAAYAQPPAQYDRDHDRDRDRAIAHERYEHWNDSHWSHDFHGRWRSFGRTFNARNDRQFISLGGNRYHVVRLEAVRGEPAIDRVTVEYNDGDTQTVTLDGRLTDGAGEVINVDPSRGIRRVMVFAQPRTRGLYSVYAG